MSTTITPTAPTMNTASSMREQLVEDLQQMELLGEITSWMLRENRGIKNRHFDVVRELKSAGLDEKVAVEFTQSQAFNRACTKLKEERVIDVIRNDKDHILFQFSKRRIMNDMEEGGQEFEYKKETKVILNKDTGELTCKNPVVLEQARKELDRCLTERTTSDISNIVTRLFESNADLIPIGVGVYFIFKEHTSFVDKIHTFLKGLGRKMQRFPVPKGTQQGDQSVQDAIQSHVRGLMEDLETSINNFTVDTRLSTMEATAKKINLNKEKLKCYKMYFTDFSNELDEFVDRANNLLLTKVEQLDEERKNLPSENKVSNRQKVLSEVTHEPQSLKDLCQSAGVNSNGIGAYLDSLVTKGGLIKTSKGYKLPALESTPEL